MENKGLLFIPDISGFSRFVSETDIEHSRLIIRELLETLINANQIGLEVSEVEGDAILFYRFGEAPGLQGMKELYRQVEKMFCEFHRHLLSYDSRRFCQCKACNTAIDLTLKVITHHGEFTRYQVKDFSKLLGKDVIVAHQLLKNRIERHEYWLVTRSVLHDDAPAPLAQWMKWDTGAQTTEGGEVPFHYTQLGDLKNGITPAPLPQPELAEKVKMISVSREYATDIITLFHATGDFNYRSSWLEGVKAVEEVAHILPRVGMRCRCVHEDGQVDVYSTSISYRPDRIEFSESEDNGNSARYFLLENTGEKKVRLTLDFYLKKKALRQTVFTILRKRNMEASLQRSLVRLDDVVKQINLPPPA